MSKKHAAHEPSKEEARRLMVLLDALSLFSRRTMVAWLPQLTTEIGVTSERFMVMFELSLQPDISLKDLAESLMISPSSLSVMIQSMVEQGLVTRLPDPADRRRVVLRLGPEGEAQFNKAEEYLVEKFQAYLHELPDTDRQELAGAADSLLQVVERILGRTDTNQQAD